MTMKNLDQEQLISNFSLMYDNSPVMVTYKKPTLEVVYCNKTMRDCAGYASSSDIVGKSDYDFCWAKFADLYIYKTCK